MRPLAGVDATKPDPAPSRTAYRLQRLWLTPTVRILCRVGLPLAALVAGAFWYLSDETRIENVKLSLAELRQTMRNRPEFMVNLMRIEDVSAEVAEDIREVTAVDFPISSFELDLAAMRAQIEELDAVARARLVIRSGGILDVEVVERVPAIVWRSHEGLELLDENGRRVAPLTRRAERADLPLIAGEGADAAVPEALALFRAAAPIGDRLRGLLRIGERRWDMILTGNQRLMLPEAGALPALERILAMNDVNALLSRDIAAIDLRDGARPTLRLGREALEALRPPPPGTAPGDDSL